MAIFFKAILIYPKIDPETGVSKRHKVSMIIDAINYQDAETTVSKIIDYFKLSQVGLEVDYTLTKIKISNLIVDTGSYILRSEDIEEPSQLNFLNFISEFDGALHSSGNGFGVYKATYNWIDITDNKKYSESAHVVTLSIDHANSIIKRYIKKYGGDGVVTKITQETGIESLLISKESLDGGIEVFNITNQ